jgi:hypothetical protein
LKNYFQIGNIDNKKISYYGPLFPFRKSIKYHLIICDNWNGYISIVLSTNIADAKLSIYDEQEKFGHDDDGDKKEYSE